MKRNIFDKIKQTKGFALVELLVVLFLIAIITAFTIPSQTIFISRTNQTIASGQLLQAINLARSEANLLGVPVSLCKSRDHLTCSGQWQDGQIIFADINHDGIVADVKQILAVFGSMHGALVNWRSSLHRDYLQILPNGMTNAENGTFWYCGSKAKYPAWAIKIRQTGRARLEYPDHKGAIIGVSCD